MPWAVALRKPSPLSWWNTGQRVRGVQQIDTTAHGWFNGQSSHGPSITRPWQ